MDGGKQDRAIRADPLNPSRWRRRTPGSRRAGPSAAACQARSNATRDTVQARAQTPPRVQAGSLVGRRRALKEAPRLDMRRKSYASLAQHQFSTSIVDNLNYMHIVHLHD